MNRRLKAAFIAALIVLSCGYCAFLAAYYNSRSSGLQCLQNEVSHLSGLVTQNEALQKTYGQLEELERLRRNHFELGQLTAKIAALRQARAQAQQVGEDELRKLQIENERLRAELSEMKVAPRTIEDRLAVDGSELERISLFFRAYARNNNGKYPTDFSDLRYYVPASVYPSIETNRFEILLPEGEVNPEPSQQILVRTRIHDDQKIRLYLYADGHLETRRTP
jgi:hypothetical protein